MKSEKELLNMLMVNYPESDCLEWNFDNDNYNVLKNSDILISDFSGVIFEFSLVYDKPVIYTSPDNDWSQYDQWWLKDELWTFKVLPSLGAELNQDSFDKLAEIIKECLTNPEYANNRQIARNETWENFGKGAQAVVDYIVDKLNELNRKEEK